jgi:hypothetical protein
MKWTLFFTVVHKVRRTLALILGENGIVTISGFITWFGGTVVSLSSIMPSMTLAFDVVLRTGEFTILFSKPKEIGEFNLRSSVTIRR